MMIMKIPYKYTVNSRRRTSKRLIDGFLISNGQSTTREDYIWAKQVIYLTIVKCVNVMKSEKVLPKTKHSTF